MLLMSTIVWLRTIRISCESHQKNNYRDELSMGATPYSETIMLKF